MRCRCLPCPPGLTDVTAAEEAAANGVDKNALADIALNTARKLGVTYADIRINRYRNESIATREQQVQNVSRGQNFGFGVRVLYKGTWGFASSRSVTPDDVRRITQQAVEIARANSVYQRKRISLVPVEKVVTTWKSAFEKDPFEVSIDDKIQFLLVAERGGDEDAGRQLRQLVRWDSSTSRSFTLRLTARGSSSTSFAPTQASP